MADMTEQARLKGPGNLLDSHGNLTSVGWSPNPELEANLEDSHFYPLPLLQWARIKVWDYYAITTPTHFFSFTISDIGYLGMVFAYVIEFATGKYQEQTLTIPLAAGVQLPRSSMQGSCSYRKGGISLQFDTSQGQRHLSVRWPGFGGSALNAEVDLAELPSHESMNIVIPIRGKRFYYNRKINCMPASGWVDYGGQRFQILPDTCLASLDWGRGVWEYKSFWVWASASGFLAGRRRIGLNLGYGFGDNSAATENCFILEGKIHKLGQVDFSYDNQHFKDPWKMTSPDGRLDLTFTPFFERVAKTNALVLMSEVHQMFGKYNGRAVTDDGEVVEIKDLIGWAEEHHARW